MSTAQDRFIQNFSDISEMFFFFFLLTDIYLLSSSLSSSKSLPGESRRGGHRVDLNGPVESRKSSSIRSSQEAEQVTLPSDHSRVTMFISVINNPWIRNWCSPCDYYGAFRAVSFGVFVPKQGAFPPYRSFCLRICDHSNRSQMRNKTSEPRLPNSIRALEWFVYTENIAATATKTTYL